ncbi:methyltransferase domain-containing protein [Phaeobacter sp. HF9A]|uniref:methyltransferase domain-containing protein n=1 Tax=Phaeobacter sp. HF9A TaxID=2721561 RepID=UPI00142F9B90|nr:methyltransferase domain-containing protein [Phaeobacter sp. HF9A]NIZ11846.1 SAM-dependent methyltransferase [Phaeobacter sp. HF9A]
MTQEPMAHPQIFDLDALRLRRARRKPEAMFLHDLARDEIEDRLSMVKRVFTNPAIIAPFAERWEGLLPGAKIIADGELLDLAPQAHDLVIHVMSLHWANDPVGQLIQCRRALKEDGLLLVVTLGGQTLHELRSALAEAETYVSGGLSPRVAPMGEIREFGALLQRAGFALPVADLVPLTVQYRDLPHLMRDLRDMGETNAMTNRLRKPTPRALFELADHIYRQNFASENGKLNATFELICLTGWSPADSQPQPLRPGSAKMRLAEALKVPESKLPDGA